MRGKDGFVVRGSHRWQLVQIPNKHHLYAAKWATELRTASVSGSEPARSYEIACPVWWTTVAL